MNLIDFDALIAEQISKLDRLLKEMDSQVMIFADTAPAFLSDWIQRHVKNTIINNVDNSIKVGEKRLAEIKHKLQETTNDLPGISKVVLGNPLTWPHRSSSKSKPGDFISPRDMIDIITRMLRPLMGYGERILISYGYSESPKSEYPAYTPGPEPSYSIGFDLPKNLADIADRYTNLYEDSKATQTKLEALYLSKKKSEVENMWNKI